MPLLPRLSVVTFTDGPVRLVAAALAEVRPIAHEIVVAVDAKVPVEELGALQGVADRVVRSEFEPPLEANLAWLHSLATGDWVLRLDSDDVVSEQLCHRLSTPGWDAGLTHVYLQYRWLVGDGSSAIAAAPWWPDPVLRLVRNEPGLVRFGTRAHELPVVAGPHQFWDEPLYHLDLVLRDVEDRRSKVRRYERDRPGLRTAAGASVSATYYLPEDRPSPPATHPLPPVDAEAIREVLASRTSARALPVVDPERLGPIVHLADRRAPAPSPGDAAVRVVGSSPLTVVEGSGAIATVGVTNRSSRTWSPTDEPADVVGARFVADHGDLTGFELREELPGPVDPGQEVLVRVPIPPWAPIEATAVKVGVVQDGVGWHDAEATVALRRIEGRRVLLSTGVSPTPHLGDDLITRAVLEAVAIHLPDVVPVLLAHPAGDLAERFGCDVATSPIAWASERRGDRSRRPRDLVSTARRIARGEPAPDEEVADLLAPFASASALVLAPGGGLTSQYAEEALQVFALEAAIARAFDLPVLVEGPSIGPLGVRKDQAMVAEILNEATRITVRDPGSLDAANRIGRDVQVELVADPATSALPSEPVDRELVRRWRHARNIPDDRAYVVVSLRAGTDGPRQVGAVRQVLEALPEHTAFVYLPHCTGDPAEDDLAMLDDPWLGAHLVAFDPALGPAAAVALVEGATITCGTRFHLSVLAAAAGVPAVAVVSGEYDRLRLRSVVAD
ncbi:MAG: polysaccharide pyruvyl transferase family protein, partial [Acidimicrobiales bacterium]|nr:polysaccharide pyruvyl transferase family protein [Acidimicrobiales bacterium]